MTLALPSGEPPGTCPPWFPSSASPLGCYAQRSSPVPHQQFPPRDAADAKGAGGLGREMRPGPEPEIGSSMDISTHGLPQPLSENPLRPQILALQRVLAESLPGLIADPRHKAVSLGFSSLPQCILAAQLVPGQSFFEPEQSTHTTFHLPISLSCPCRKMFDKLASISSSSRLMCSEALLLSSK